MKDNPDRGPMTVAAFAFIIEAALIALAVWGCDKMATVQWPSR